MIKPERLHKGDKVAIVSLSRGLLGEKAFLHKFELAKERLKGYGLDVVAMPNALKGIDYLYRHPEARAQDLMDAFSSPEIKAVFNAIGGDDTIRLLPYIDFDVLRNHPKIFTGCILLWLICDEQYCRICVHQRIHQKCSGKDAACAVGHMDDPRQ